MNNHYLINLPHCGVDIPNKYMNDYLLPEEELFANIFEYADLFTDELFENLYKEFGGLKNRYSRLFFDPERFFDDSKESMAEFGLGWFYEQAIIEKRSLRDKEHKDEISEYYRQYHDDLTHKTKEKLIKYNR